MLPTNTTIGQEILESRGLNFDGYLFWISLGALFGFALLLNIGFTLALTFLKSKFFFVVILYQLEINYICVPKLIQIQLLGHLVP